MASFASLFGSTASSNTTDGGNAPPTAGNAGYSMMFPALPTQASSPLSTQVRSTPSRQFLQTVFGSISRRNPNMPVLPAEIQQDIIDMVIGDTNNGPASLLHRPHPSDSHPALIAPWSGASPFMSLPAELRRAIFAESLSVSDTAYKPLCDDNDADVSQKQKRKEKTHISAKAAHTIPNLMTINRIICEEITEMLYEERTFVIHVHEGLKAGGVEILQAGRQPLQYQDCEEDTRFAKFTHGEEFGFQRMKKVVIQIFPTTEDQDRHVAINTHFMVLALCRLLERPTNGKNDSQRITSIKIEFAQKQTSSTSRTSRAAIIRHEKPWMDENGPKQSSIHNVSDIEIALRPFAMLTRCHSASIELPAYLAGNVKLATFASNLEQSMMSKTGTLMPNDNLERQIEQLRYEMEAHVKALLYGNGNRTTVAKLTDKDMMEDDPVDSDIEPDEAVVFLGDTVSANTRSRKKHVLSPTTANEMASAPKRKKEATEEGEQSKRLIRRDLTRVVRDSVKKAGETLSPGEIEERVQALMDSEEEFCNDVAIAQTMMDKTQATETSLLHDLELAGMGEDVQMDLAIQLSTGKTRRQLGLEELKESHPRDKVANSPFTGEGRTLRRWARGRSRNLSMATRIAAIRESNRMAEEEGEENDWQLDLIKQNLSDGTPAKALQAMCAVASTDDAENAATATPWDGWNADELRSKRRAQTTGTLESPLKDLMVDIDYGTTPTSPALNNTSISTTSGPNASFWSNDSTDTETRTEAASALPNLSFPGPATATQQRSHPFDRPIPTFALPTSQKSAPTPTPTPRTLTQAEDSGIGMMASDDGGSQQHDEQFWAKLDEDMLNAPMES